MTNGLNGHGIGEEEAEDTVRKTIRVKNEVFDGAERRRREEGRSFSSYIAWLIRRDLGEVKPALPVRPAEVAS